MANQHFGQDAPLGPDLYPNSFHPLLKEQVNKIKHARECEADLVERLAGVVTDQLYRGAGLLNTLIKNRQQKNLTAQLKNQRLQLIEEMQKYELLLPVNSLEHLARKNARLEEQLALAIKVEATLMIHQLLQMKIKPTIAHFFNAVMVNSPEILEILYQKNPKIDLNQAWGNFSLMHLACAEWTKPTKAIRWLIDHQVSTDVKESHRGWTPLHWGIFRNSLDFEAIQLILESMYDVNAQSLAGETVLHLAMRETNRPEGLALIQLLLNYVNPNFKDEEGNTPLHKACLIPNQSIKDCILALLAGGAHATVLNKSGNTPLHLLALRSCDRGSSQENITLADLLIAKGGDVN